MSMSVKPGLHVMQEDITKLGVDAIVNAANSSLLGAGGVDGAIHRAAGTELLEECRLLRGCKTGQAKITKGYKLPAKHVIHTVGPVWQDGEYHERELLASCYRESLRCATKHGLRSIAFPCISTGVYGFPQNLAAPIAINTTHAFLAEESTSLQTVVYVCFLDEDFQLYQSLMS